MVTSESVSESNEKLIGFIANTVEKLRDDMVTMQSGMAMIQSDMVMMQSDMATMRSDMATMRGEMATKQDLARLDGRLSERIDAVATGIRGDIEQVHLRLDGIERAVSSRMDHVEGQLSRLRSAVYVLSKDRPDILRLLGQNGG